MWAEECGDEGYGNWSDHFTLIFFNWMKNSLHSLVLYNFKKFFTWLSIIMPCINLIGYNTDTMQSYIEFF